MLRRLFCALLVVATSLSLVAQSVPPSAWLDDWTTAMRAADKSGKLVLIDATGSDWAPPSRRQEFEVFSQPGFVEALSVRFVLLRLDYPHNNNQMEAIRAQNETLRKTLVLLNLPTTLLADKTGKLWGRYEGAVEGGPPAYLAMVEALVKSKGELEALERAVSVAAAGTAEKAKALHALFERADATGLAYQYASLPGQIIALDKGNKLGLANRYQVYNRYTRLLATWADRSEYSSVITDLTALASAVNDQPDLRQKILFTRGMVQWNALRDELAAKASFREALPLAPGSATGQRIVSLLPLLP